MRLRASVCSAPGAADAEADIIPGDGAGAREVADAMRCPIEVHGGLAEPVDRTVPPDRIEEFTREVAELVAVPIDEADLSSLYRIGDGGLSPLTGPMTREVFDRVLDDEVLVHNGQEYAWTIPISFPVEDDLARRLKVGQRVRLVDPRGRTVGAMLVEDVFDYDKRRYLASVYGTERTDHPGGRMVMQDRRNKLIGGPVEVLPPPKHPEYGQYVLSPRQTRALFTSRGWERIVAFQTRNPLHRAHEYALVVGLERLTRAGYFAGAVLNPLIGETKSDDVDAATRMRTYRVLIENRLLGEGDKDEALWREKGYDLNDQVLLLGLDIKMFYAGPKEAIMHAIYRQNFGFTDIIIGRKHADAPFDDGSDIWDPLAAQRKFDELRGRLLIQPVKVGFAVFYEELGRVGLIEEYESKGYHPISISGRELRRQLREGRMPDPRIMRPQVAEILIEKMHGAAS